MYSVFTSKPVVLYGFTSRCKIFTPSPTSYTKSGVMHTCLYGSEIPEAACMSVYVR